MSLGLGHVIRKEFVQLRRDTRMIPIIFVAPVVQLTVLGYAASLDVVDLRVAVCDEDSSPSSRDLVRTMTASGQFVETSLSKQCLHEEKLFEAGQAQLAVHIPRGFEDKLDRGEQSPVLVTIDGSDTIPAGQGASRTLLSIERFNRDHARSAGLEMALSNMPGVDVRDRVWYNPELRSRWFFVPGILALLLMLMTMILTSMAVVKEKERGTLESIIVSPLSPITLITGKLIPFVAIGLMDVFLVVGVARVLFGVPLQGSVPTLLTVCLLFIANTTGLGLLISTVSATQQEAMMSSMFFVMLPFIYLSGFVFPVESMPESVQWVTEIIPLKHFLVAIRAVFLKGSDLEDLWRECAWLLATGLAVFALSTARLRKRLA